MTNILERCVICNDRYDVRYAMCKKCRDRKEREWTAERDMIEHARKERNWKRREMNVPEKDYLPLPDYWFSQDPEEAQQASEEAQLREDFHIQVCCPYHEGQPYFECEGCLVNAEDADAYPC